MLIKVIGWMYTILGVWWLFKPEGARRYFARKINKNFRRIILTLVFIISAVFINAAFRMQGVWAKVLFVLGLLGAIKGIIFLKSKLFEKAAKWCAERPLWIWRLWAALAIALGLILLNIR